MHCEEKDEVEQLTQTNPIRPGLFLGAWARGDHGIGMKFGRVVENHKLINLV